MSQLLYRPCFSSQTDQCYSSVLQLSFIQKIAGNYILEVSGNDDPKTRREERAVWLLFLCFSSPLGLPYVNWASQECCLFYLRSSLRSSDLPLIFLCSIFAGSSLPCLLATTIWTPVSYSNYVTLSIWGIKLFFLMW